MQYSHKTIAFAYLLLFSIVVQAEGGDGDGLMDLLEQQGYPVSFLDNDGAPITYPEIEKAYYDIVEAWTPEEMDQCTHYEATLIDKHIENGVPVDLILQEYENH